MKKITIRNFGPIQNIEDLEIKDFMVFIGPQASGKSTVAKATYFFKSIRTDIIRYLLESFEKGFFNRPTSAIEKIIRQKFLDLWGSSWALDPQVYLHYEYQPDYSISISLTPGDKYVNPKFSSALEDDLIQVVEKCRTYLAENSFSNGFASESDKIIKDTERAAFKAGLIQQINQILQEDEEIIFIPAGRAVLTVLTEEIAALNSRKVDFLTREFASKVNDIKPLFNKTLDDIITEQQVTSTQRIAFPSVRGIQKKIKGILKGEYRYERGEERIYYNKGKYVKINFASSGQQESLWILLLIFVRVLSNSKVFIVFEEPEAHLFPDAQKEMVELIAMLRNARSGNKIMLTTHSPYILTALNNLLFAHQTGKNNPSEVQKVVDKSSWLSPTLTDAFFVEKGNLTSIMHEGLIQAERIDEISNKINTAFHQLFEYE